MFLCISKLTILFPKTYLATTSNHHIQKIKTRYMRPIVMILLTMLFTTSVKSQTPERISYQAIIRNNSNQLLADKKVSMRISIQKYLFGFPPTYTNVYVETHKPTTNSNGLVSVQIGGGTVVGGSFSSIDWSDGTYYIQTETDTEGGTSYSITGKSQVLSVPYAINAKNVDNVQTDSTLSGKGNATHPLKLAQQSASAGQTMQWDGTSWKPGASLSLHEHKIRQFGLFNFKTSDVVPLRISYQELGLANENDMLNFFIVNLEVGWQPSTNFAIPDQFRSLKDGIYYELCLPQSGFSGIKVYFPDKIEYWDQTGRILYILTE